MKKFNRFERHLLESGLEMIKDDMKHEICKIEAKGKNPIMTQEYVDMIILDLETKIKEMTLKTK